VEHFIQRALFVRCSIKRFNRRDRRYGAIDKSTCDRFLLAFGSEERRGKGLGQGLDKGEEGDGRKNDESKGPGAGEREDEACDACCEVLKERTKGQGRCGPDVVCFSK
jgi:hypothetical protein